MFVNNTGLKNLNSDTGRQAVIRDAPGEVVLTGQREATDCGRERPRLGPLKRRRLLRRSPCLGPGRGRRLLRERPVDYVGKSTGEERRPRREEASQGDGL